MDNLPEALTKRLHRLPNKAMRQLEGLLSIGHIDQHVLETVLDAGELSQETDKLPAFATSYLYLKSQGVPVADVIQMAKQNDRRVNLWWSAKRWQDVHGKLSRLATLQRLANEHIDYDMSFFSEHLTNEYTGYLVRNSRRLGMEGLRQRHCVASWHDKLAAGNTAICVVFMNRTRWTVELLKTMNADQPIRIGQIKARMNRNPTQSERTAIYAQLGIEDAIQGLDFSTTRSNNARWRSNLSRILVALRQHQASSVEVSFSGGGDSGHIYDIAIGPDTEIGEHNMEIMSFNRVYEDGGWVVTEELVTKSIRDAIEDMTYGYLETTDVDWYNNEGGQGELSIDMENEVVSLYVDANYTECHREYDNETDFADLLHQEEQAA